MSIEEDASSRVKAAQDLVERVAVALEGSPSYKEVKATSPHIHTHAGNYGFACEVRFMKAPTHLWMHVRSTHCCPVRQFDGDVCFCKPRERAASQSQARTSVRQCFWPSRLHCNSSVSSTYVRVYTRGGEHTYARRKCQAIAESKGGLCVTPESLKDIAEALEVAVYLHLEEKLMQFCPDVSKWCS